MKDWKWVVLRVIWIACRPGSAVRVKMSTGSDPGLNSFQEMKHCNFFDVCIYTHCIYTYMYVTAHVKKKGFLKHLSSKQDQVGSMKRHTAARIAPSLYCRRIKHYPATCCWLHFFLPPISRIQDIILFAMYSISPHCANSGLLKSIFLDCT